MMFFSNAQQYNLRKLGVFLLSGVLLGLIYVAIVDGFSELFPFINGFFVGLLLAASVGSLELYVFPSLLNRKSFPTILLIKSFSYILLFLVIYINTLIITRMIRDGASYGEVLRSAEFRAHMETGDFKIAFLYLSFAAITGISTLQLSKNLGRGMLSDIVSGRYQEPQSRFRVIMFLRIMHIDQIIKILGMKTFYQFVNDFHYDIAEALIRYRGHIYQYSNDEIVIYWKGDAAFQHANAIRFFFAIEEKLAFQREQYIERYGHKPEVGAGIHAGELMISEMGDIKMDIVFHGDTMNTTARIADYCSEGKHGLIISSELLSKFQLPITLDSQSLGLHRMKGKQEEIELIKIFEKDW